MQSPTPSQPGPVSTPAAAAAAAAAGAGLTPPEFAVRPVLPDRNVTDASIEDAYVRFIFYCNPALPLDADTAGLREAFRSPPRSAGKIFSTFTIFELVRRFYNKEIRTWAELITTLGVELPDPSKDESAQKIAQYGVRLKKWMNSMHVKAFFEYLMNITNDYWTNIPTDPNPVSQPVRDGVAVEDDMALRALLPHIRPKRGRKRPTDGDLTPAPTQVPGQRARLSPASALDDPRQGSHAALSAYPSINSQQAPWTPSEGVPQAPLTRWPVSAVTPSSRTSFWDDTLEPRSAVTPSKSRLGSQRRGPKNVSSAWRPGDAEGTAKTRGRPPIKRPSLEPPISPLPFETSTPSHGETAASTTSRQSSLKPSFPLPSTTQEGPPQKETANLAGIMQPRPNWSESSRPQRPSISLQVPERPTGSVRLATPPPPLVVINGDADGGQSGFADGASIAPSPNEQTLDAHRGLSPPRQHKSLHQAQDLPLPSNLSKSPYEEEIDPARDIPHLYFEKHKDQTNVAEFFSRSTRDLSTAEWFDPQGRPAPGPDAEEIMVVSNAIIEDLYRRASTDDVFLMNLSTTCGGSHLLKRPLKITRYESDAEVVNYRLEWEYCFGPIRGQFKMLQPVPLAMFPSRSGQGHGGSDGDAAASSEQSTTSTYDMLVNRCRDLCDIIAKRDEEIKGIQARMMESFRQGSMRR